MRFDLLHPADQIIMIMQRIYDYGMTTMSGGNLSVMDDLGDIWISPSGIDKGTLSRKDIMQVKPDGAVIGAHTPSVELPFHQHIYQIRPDLKGIVHAHPPALVSFSIARKLPDITLLPDVGRICGKLGMAEYEVPGSKELGVRIAQKFSEGCDTVVMENHGVVVGKNDLFSAFMAFETLNAVAGVQIEALRLGAPIGLTSEQLNLSAMENPMHDTFKPCIVSSEERATRREMTTLIRRSYDQGMLSSTQGTFACRLSDGSYVITPRGMDRKYLDPEDFVRIQNNQCEAGKTPSRAALLVGRIFDAHPSIDSVIIAAPPSLMAFAVTSAPFDSRTIPESYIMLRGAQKIPYGSTSGHMDETISLLSPRVPLLIQQNDCVIVTGSSLLNAFDRLEVAEFSAKSIIAARSIGPLVSIDDEGVRQIEISFHLL